MLQNVHVPTTSYLVCASQRSGTTLLCRAHADTGIADWPDEYFLAVDDEELPGWHCWEDGPSGAQDGFWVVSDEEPVRPRASPQYGFDLINGLEGLIVESESGWRQLFGELGLTPFRGGL
jgi:LPS sulfotransferase NodH